MNANEMALLRSLLTAPCRDDDGYPICVRCGVNYWLDDGTEPTPLCHGCAHEICADTIPQLLDFALSAGQAELVAMWPVVDAAHMAQTGHVAESAAECVACLRATITAQHRVIEAVRARRAAWSDHEQQESDLQIMDALAELDRRQAIAKDRAG